MKTSSFIFMLVAEGIITFITFYYFIKVLFSKPKVDSSEDSFSENDT